MRTLLMVLATVALVGCSKKKPTDKCNDWVSKICGRAVSCQVTDGASCKAAIAQQVDCAKTKGVSSTYDQCLKDVGNASCDALFDANGLELPNSCMGAILQ
jgi:hypothetical protein